MEISDGKSKKISAKFGRKYWQWRYRLSHILQLPIWYIESRQGKKMLPKLLYFTIVANWHNELVAKGGRDCGNPSMNAQCMGVCKHIIEITDWSFEEKFFAKKYLDEKWEYTNVAITDVQCTN